MVEVHLMGPEATSAILAWHSSEISQELKGRALPLSDAVDLALAIPPVVLDVVRALARSAGHPHEDEQAFESCQ
jgi:hypothetical protein